jgi:hypothetical protein
LGEKER